VQGVLPRFVFGHAELRFRWGWLEASLGVIAAAAMAGRNGALPVAWCRTVCVASLKVDLNVGTLQADRVI